MSPSRALRAPLLWLLLPFMAGLIAADWRPPSLSELRWAGGGALAAALLAGAILRWRGRGSQTAWEIALMTAALTAGYAWLPLRSPPRFEWTGPPREVSVVLAVEQVFPPAPQRKTFSGLARIVAAEPPVAGIAGQRVYFAAIRRISLLPEISGHYRYRGLIEPVPRSDGASRGFDRYLDSHGIQLRLMRGQLSGEEKPPHGFRQFCGRAQERLVRILHHGLGRHPEIISLYQAMLLGEKAVLSSEQQGAFMRSGVFHIFSISGLHVGVIALAILSVLALLRVPKRVASVTGLLVLWLYVQVTGGSTPAERAFLMISFLVASRVFRLPGNPLAALAGAAFTTLLLDPRQLFTTGFQMSYTVVTALVIMGGPIADHWRSAWRPWGWLPEANWGKTRIFLRWLGRKALVAIAITWAAVLASTPGSIGNFGLLSPGALLGNLLIVPLAGLAITGGFVSLLCGLLGLLPVSVLMNHAAALTIVIMDALVRRASGWPGVYFDAAFEQTWMGPAAVVIVLGTMALAARGPGPARRIWWPLVAVGLVLILGVKFS